jgi:hypothetical protein
MPLLTISRRKRYIQQFSSVIKKRFMPFKCYVSYKMARAFSEETSKVAALHADGNGRFSFSRNHVRRSIWSLA